MAWFKKEKNQAVAEDAKLNKEELRLKDEFRAVNAGTFMRTRAYRTTGIDGGPAQTQWLEAFVTTDGTWQVKRMVRHDALGTDADPAPVQRTDYRQGGPVSYFDAVIYMAVFEQSQTGGGNYALSKDEKDAPGESYFRTLAEGEAIVFDYDGLPHPVNENGEVLSDDLFPPDAFDKARAAMAAKKPFLEEKKKEEEFAEAAQVQYQLTGVFKDMSPLRPCEDMAQMPAWTDPAKKEAVAQLFTALEILERQVKEEEQRNESTYEHKWNIMPLIDSTRRGFASAAKVLCQGQDIKYAEELMRAYNILELNLLFTYAIFFRSLHWRYSGDMDRFGLEKTALIAPQIGSKLKNVGYNLDCRGGNLWDFVRYNTDRMVCTVEARSILNWFERVRFLAGVMNESQPTTTKVLPAPPKVLPPGPSPSPDGGV